MIESITSGITTVIGWLGTVVTSFTTAEGDLYTLLPLLGIGIAVSCVMLGIRMLRSFTWGA